MSHDNRTPTSTQRTTTHAASRSLAHRTVHALLALTLLLVPACDPAMMGTADPVPLSAKYQAMGEACTIEVTFSRAVHTFEGATVPNYRLASGEQAIAAEVLEDLHIVAVTFPEPVALLATVIVGTDFAVSLELSINETDEQAASLLTAEFPADAIEATVRLTFDDAIDPVVAQDVTRYSLGGTIDHPLRAEVVGCGDQVDLFFERLGAVTQLDIDPLIDVNGIETAAMLNTPVVGSSEENRPALESAVFSPDDATASIRATFTEAVDQASVVTTNFLLLPDEITPTAAEVAFDGRTVVLSFDSLDPPASLTVSGIVDLNKNPMAAEVQVDVEIGSDVETPSVSSVGIVGQGEDVVVRVTFSEAVCAEAAAAVDNYQLVGAGDVSMQPTTAVLRPGGSTVDLMFDFIPVEATIIAANICDLSGKLIEEGNTTLDSDLDVTPPAVASLVFTPDATDPSVDVAFDEPVEATSAQTIENYTFADGTSPAAAVLQDDSRTVRLSTGVLAATDTLSITGVSDETGNVIVLIQDLPIGGGDDDTAPTISTAAFVPDQLTPTIDITFGETVDTLSAETISHYTATSPSSTARTAALQPDGRTVRLTFGPLDRATEITVNGVTDSSGQVITTASTAVVAGDDESGPEPLSAQFIAGQAVPTVDVEFSEAIDRTLAQTPGLFLASDRRTAPTSATLQDDSRTVRLLFSRLENTDNLAIQSVTDLSGQFMTTVDDFDVGFATDSEPPFALSAQFTANALAPTVRIEFNEAVDKSSAETLTNYRTVTGSVKPTSAVLQDNSRTVELVFPPIEREDVIGISAVQDFAGQSVATGHDIAIASDAELTLPTVTSATVSSTIWIIVVFSEAVDESTAELATNYTGFPTGITTQTATVQSDGRTVILTLTGGTITAGKNITVAGVTDLNGNLIAEVTLTLG